MRQLFFILLVAFSFTIRSQTFVSSANQLGIIEQYVGGYLGGGVSFCDFNNDGWDDLSFAQNGTNPHFYQNNNGIMTPIESFIFNTDEMKQLTWVDYDNDGDRDLFTTSLFGPFRLFENDGLMNLTDVTETSGLPWTEYMSFGNSWGDYDRDGFLDVYISTYNGTYFPDPTVENFFYRNNGDGTFTDKTIEAGISNGANYTFMSLWFDYNNDLWPDLFVINDRIESANYLYRNNGDGTFTDVSIESNMDDHIYSMCNSGDDYDNDGDIDMYVTNSTPGNLLKRNNGDGTFTNAAASTGTLLNRFTWGAQFIDADNDTWQDLHVCSTPHILQNGENQFLKNVNGVFSHYETQAGIQNDVGWSRSSAMGDLNNDGFPDLAILKNAPDYASVLRNTSSENNWLKVTLEGVQSNRDGISSWIECYAGGQKFVRYTYCGESYLAQNSTSEFFGLADYSLVDSLIVRWTSGVVDRWFRIPANQSLHLKEGNGTEATIFYEGNLLLCENDSIILSAGAWPEVLWSTGEMDSSIVLYENASIYLLVTDPEGNQFLSDTIQIQEVNLPLINTSIIEPACNNTVDGSILLQGNFVLWDNIIVWNEDTVPGSAIQNIGQGLYHYHFLDDNRCKNEGTIEMNAPDSLTVIANVQHVLCHGENSGQVSLVIEGGTPEYYIDWLGYQPNSLIAGEYNIPFFDSHNCSSNAIFEISEPEAMEITVLVSDVLCYGENTGAVSIEVSGGVGEYVYNFGQMDPTALYAGQYEVHITDENNCEVTSFYEIQQPGPLEMQLITTPYFENGLPGSVVAFVNGGVMPYFLEILTLNGEPVDSENLNAGVYNVLLTDAHQCSSNQTATIDFISGISAQKEVEMKSILFPNPAQDAVTIQSPFSGTKRVEIYDSSGLLLSSLTSNNTLIFLPTHQLPSGHYYVSVQSDFSSEHLSLVVQH